MMNYRGKRRSRYRQRGVVAIEVALGLLAFLAFIFYWIEVSYMGFVSSVVDYAVVEASKVSRHDAGTSSEGYYTQKFSDVLEMSDSIWAHFLDEEQFKTEIRYYTSVENLEAGEQTDSSILAPLAVYRLSYPYQPLFLSLFMPSEQVMSISREIIAVQEYERSKFQY